MSDGESVEARIARLDEKLAGALHRTRRAHERLDASERAIKEELKAIRQDIAAIREEMRPIIAFQNQALGAKAALLVVAGGIGAAITWAADSLLPHP